MPTPAEIERRDPRLPGWKTATRLFGSWSKALDAAGIEWHG